MPDMEYHIGQRVVLDFGDGEDYEHGTVYHIDGDTLFVEMDDGTHECEPDAYFRPLDEPDQEPNFYAVLSGFCVLSERYDDANNDS